MSDLIYREDAIGAIESTDWYHQNRNGEMVHGANSEEDQPWFKSQDVYDALKKVLSAQPDLCEGCRWEFAFGYGECGRCKRSYDDMYEVNEDG